MAFHLDEYTVGKLTTSITDISMLVDYLPTEFTFPEMLYSLQDHGKIRSQGC